MRGTKRWNSSVGHLQREAAHHLCLRFVQYKAPAARQREPPARHTIRSIFDQSLSSVFDALNIGQRPRQPHAGAASRPG